MGLDISYYSNLKIAGPTTGEDSDYDCDVTVWNENCFEYQLGSLKRDHLYESTTNSQYGNFRAGSYSGYNQWRNELAKMAGYSSADEVWQDEEFDSFKKFNLRKDKLDSISGDVVEKPKPFYELINFSDAEGVIGPEVSKKLYEDFVEFDEKAQNHTDSDSWFYQKYQEWKKAFKIASQNGAVSFH